MKYRYAALFVLYHPSEQNVSSILDQARLFERVYIYDNSDRCFDHVPRFADAQYIGYKRNDGLSVAYNQMIRLARSEQIDWLFLFDQDSRINAQTVHIMQQFAENTDPASTALLAPAIQLRGKPPVRAVTKPLTWAINSGQLLNLSCLAAHGICHDENIFLDYADRDFCRQITNAGLSILQVGGAVLEHELGDIYRGFYVHSPIRHYYTHKSRLYYNRKYYPRFVAAMRTATQLLRHKWRILRTGRDVGKTFQMLKAAQRDYKAGKLGKISES